MGVGSGSGSGSGGCSEVTGSGSGSGSGGATMGFEVDPLPTRLKITGTVVLGNVVIRERLQGETKREARRRRRAEKRELKAARKRGQHSLPPGRG